jgi:hypothetical protein
MYHNHKPQIIFAQDKYYGKNCPCRSGNKLACNPLLHVHVSEKTGNKYDIDRKADFTVSKEFHELSHQVSPENNFFSKGCCSPYNQYPDYSGWKVTFQLVHAGIINGNSCEHLDSWNQRNYIKDK